MPIKAFFYCLFSLASVLAVPAALAASDGPAAVLSNLTAQVKKRGNVLPILDYVDWDAAFAQLTSAEKAHLRLQSPEALRAHQALLYGNPARFAEGQLQHELAKQSPEQQALLKSRSQMIVQSTVSQVQKLNSLHAQSQFEVGAARVTADKAAVELTAKYPGGKSVQQIEFIQRGGKWLMPQFQPLVVPQASSATQSQERSAVVKRLD